MRRSARKRREVVRYDPSDVVARGRERGDDDDEDDDDGVKRTRGRPTRKRARAATTTTKATTKARQKSVKRRRVEKESTARGELPDDAWMTICEMVCRDVDEDKKRRANRAGDFVDKRKDVYKKRLCALFAMRETCSQLRRLLNGAFGEELFRRLFERLAEFSDAARGESNAPATMLWRHKAWYLTKLGCQGCDKHATTRKPNWTFGVRMCKECLMKRTVCDWELTRDEEWTKHGTYEELTVGLPSDEVHGWSEFWRAAYVMTRFWKKSVKKRIALLKRAKTPAERAEICAPPKPRENSHSVEKNARERREKELKAELALVGCEIRGDSKLSELFIDGFPGKRRDRERWTAKAVARRMAEMKYIHEYCDEFEQIIEDWRQEIGELHEEGFYGNINAEVTGFRDFGDAVRNLADGWSDFPARWPWLPGPAA